jgi:antirestriction protein
MTTETKEITNSDDLIDVRDVIARVEELESIDGIQEQIDALERSDEATELVGLRELLGELEGNGGDEEWRGSWYPITLVRDSYFEDFARDEAEQLGLVKSDASWPYTCIDWEQAAEQLQMDYGNVEFDGITYWYR